MSSAKKGPPVACEFRHMGLSAVDIAPMEDFYVRVLGFTITDRGNEGGMDVIFLSRSPQDHHQIVLTSGRPPNIPNNLHNPAFGPVVNQISFLVESLEALKQFDAYLDEVYPNPKKMYANHGNAWSLYVPDPEGNQIEVYADTPFFCHQPMMKPLELKADKEEILAATKQLALDGRGFKSQAEWRAEIATIMSAAAP